MTAARPRRFPLALSDVVREPGAGSAPAGARARRTAAAERPVERAAPRQLEHPAPRPVERVAPRPLERLAPRPVERAVPRPAIPVARPATAGLSGALRQPARLVAKPASKNTVGRPAPLQRAAVLPTMSLTSERVRERMVERLRASGLRDPRVIDGMARVPRHLFVDAGLAPQAYEDAALPIGHHQTISKPSIVARMLELARGGRELGNVLEIGTGCGYQAAVLASIAREVYSIERVKMLYERAKTNLRPLRLANIRLHYGDGRLGLPAIAPFDAIVIAAAGLDVPPALADQLAIGGRLVAPVGATQQVLILVERLSARQWRESRLDDVFFVPLKSGVI